MSVNETSRAIVRQRAQFACEYCGLRENDVGGELTVDHYQPRTKGGSDALDNLVYCCTWCNQRKLAYWPQHPNDVVLWNPRQSTATEHFLLLDSGELHPISAIGLFTLRRLQLNRPALIAYRLRQRYLAEQSNLLTHYRDLLGLQTELIRQLTGLLEEQQALLTEQQAYLALLYQRRGSGG